MRRRRRERLVEGIALSQVGGDGDSIAAGSMMRLGHSEPFQAHLVGGDELGKASTSASEARLTTLEGLPPDLRLLRRGKSHCSASGLARSR
jgi:hypothetical protein